ncbi:MAG: SpoIID/LytB domain-containing protein [Candidatus Dadabacteria bacterium]|nr:MAG: SpoIID/LytB domain-containing protein [Candidatus Dadabacteria bacterium]
MARDVVVALPVGSSIRAQSELHWRDRSGKRGSGRTVALSGLSAPVRLRGDGLATGAGLTFPLPADVERLKGRWVVRLEMDLERYLAGVVPYEMNPNWPDEALRAQAVLARTFALKRIEQRRKNGAPWDLVAGTEDQVFHWQEHPPRRIVQLIRSTAGEVMRTRDGALAEVFYHSCSGGHTADPAEVWGRPVAGLTTVEDTWDDVCPDFFWSLSLSPAELGTRLGTGPVDAIEILERGPSGRVVRIAVTAAGATQEWSGLKFRSAVGPRELKSTLFQVRVGDRQGAPVWLFQGSGSGHGVGLSQFGAKVMAERGHDYREILAFYFPRLQLDD